MNKKLIAILATIMVLTAITGCNSNNINEDKKTPQQSSQIDKQTNTQNNDANKPTAKVLVNISGKIISIDNNKITLDNNLAILIDNNTIFADDPDCGSKEVSKEFKVGNFIQGYTSDDFSQSTVTADNIYTNR